MKKVIILLGVLFTITGNISCSKDKVQTCTCTTYLNGSVYSTKTVSNCDNCFAPQGYTTSCNCD